MIRTHYVGELGPEMNGKEVVLAGWVHEVRETSKITFLLLRDKTGIVQVIGKRGTLDDSLIASMSLQKESVVMVKGMVKANREARAGFEIVPSEVRNLNPLSAQIPFEVTGKVPAEIDVRLNYRYVDLRRLESSAVFRIQSTILTTFRNTMLKQGFQEIRTPSIIGEASEGGADVFHVQYFENDAFLAQSPQLYKQLAVIGGMDKVFMVCPAFRAEKSNTVYHLTESTQMDIEMGFADHEDAMALLGSTVTSILEAVKRENSADMNTLGVKFDVPKVVVVGYEDAVSALTKAGHVIKSGEDFTREDEEGLQKIYGDCVIVRDYPTAVRAFYSMPNANNPEVSNSYDFIYKGMEISSGAQRIHIPELLVDAIRKRGLNPKNFESYISAFRCGAPPHAGWSIGLERLTMKVANLPNIREASLFPRDRKRLSP